MKKKTKSSVSFVVALAIFMVGFFSPFPRAAEPDGVTYTLDFSDWQPGTYTADEFIEMVAQKTNHTITAERYPQGSEGIFEVVREGEMDGAVLKMTVGASVDGFKVFTDQSMTGKNITYSIDYNADTTSAANGEFGNKFVNDGNTMVTGQIYRGDQRMHLGGTWQAFAQADTQYRDKSWTRETLVLNTQDHRFQWLVNGRRISYGGSEDLAFRGNRNAVNQADLYGKNITVLFRKITFSTVPDVYGIKYFSGSMELEQNQITEDIDRIDILFDHALDDTTITAEHVKLLNVTSGQYVTPSGITYTDAQRTISVDVGGCTGTGDSYRLVLSGIKNTDGIVMENRTEEFAVKELVLEPGKTGTEYAIDFSGWTEGGYTPAELTQAGLEQGLEIEDAFPANNWMTYEIVQDAVLGQKVLKLTNTGSGDDGLLFSMAQSLAGENVTYFVKGLDGGTLGSYGLNNKYLYDKSNLNVAGTSGQMYSAINLYYAGGWRNIPNDLTGYERGSWTEETLVLDTGAHTLRHFVNGRMIPNIVDETKGYEIPFRNFIDGVGVSKIYTSREFTTYLAKIGFRNYPVILEDQILVADTPEADYTAVNPNATELKVRFDHAMEPGRILPSEITLTNTSTGQPVILSRADLSYDPSSRSVSVNVAEKLEGNAAYVLSFENTVTNTDGYAVKNAELRFATREDVLAVTEFGFYNTAGEKLTETEHVIPDSVAAIKGKLNAAITKELLMQYSYLKDKKGTEDLPFAADDITIGPVDGEFTIALAGKFADGDSYQFILEPFESAGLTLPRAFASTPLIMRGPSVDFYYNDFNEITQETVTAAELNNENQNAVITPMNEDQDSLQIINQPLDFDNKAVSMTRPEDGTAAGIKLAFAEGKDLFALLGNRNVVAELDFYIDYSTLSTYAAFGRMNNTACLYIQNNEAVQQTVGTLLEGVNGKSIHYKWVMDQTTGTMRVFADGIPMALNNTFDIPFRNPSSLPSLWEIYVQKGDLSKVIFDNLRIRNYPEASLLFESNLGTNTDCGAVLPMTKRIVLSFDNKMKEAAMLPSAVILKKGTETVNCEVSAYDPGSGSMALNVEGLLLPGETYTVEIAGDVVNTENKALAENVISFTTNNPADVSVLSAASSGADEITLKFDGYLDTDTVSPEVFAVTDGKGGGYTVESASVVTAQGGQTQQVVLNFAENLAVGSHSVLIEESVKDYYGRDLAGRTIGFEIEDRVWTANASCYFATGAQAQPQIDVITLRDSAYTAAALTAAYYEDGALVAVSTGGGVLNSGAATTISAEALDVAVRDQTARRMVKLFVWDSLEAIRPLCPVNEIYEQTHLYIVGDSKVSEYYPQSYPQQGWGHYMGDYLNSSAVVVNKALGGASTYSYRYGKEGSNYKAWDTVAGAMEKGDYVIIDLAHNDEYGDAYTRTTLAQYQENIREYVREIRAAEATPILMSTVPHVRNSPLANPLAERGAAMKAVAEELGVVFLDVNGKTFGDFEAIGDLEEVRNRYFLSSYALKNTYGLTEEQIAALPNSSVTANGYDYIHLSEGGADYVAGVVAQLLKESACPLGNYVK